MEDIRIELMNFHKAKFSKYAKCYKELRSPESKIWKLMSQESFEILKDLLMDKFFEHNEVICQCIELLKKDGIEVE